MVFSKKWLRNHSQFLLHFLIHIDVLMLCKKFELIPTNNFRVMTIQFPMVQFLMGTLLFYYITVSTVNPHYLSAMPASLILDIIIGSPGTLSSNTDKHTHNTVTNRFSFPCFHTT